MMAKILTIIISIVLPILPRTIYRNSILPKIVPQYDICVLSGSGNKVLLYFIYIPGMVMLSLSPLLEYINVMNTRDSWVLYSLGLFFTLLALISFFDVYLNYTALNGDEIIVYRLGITKTVQISDIKRIVCFSQSRQICFFKRDGNKYRSLFSVDADAEDAAEFEHIVEAKCDEDPI